MPNTEVMEKKLPHLVTALPGPNAKKVVELDAEFVSPSCTRDYPLVAKSGIGATVDDVDGNTFLDFAAGIAVVATGHCHPEVVAAIQKQAAELIHMSGTDFYYSSLAELAKKLSSIAPGKEPKKPAPWATGPPSLPARPLLTLPPGRGSAISAITSSWTSSARGGWGSSIAPGRSA